MAIQRVFVPSTKRKGKYAYKSRKEVDMKPGIVILIMGPCFSALLGLDVGSAKQTAWTVAKPVRVRCWHGNEAFTWYADEVALLEDGRVIHFFGVQPGNLEIIVPMEKSVIERKSK